MSETTRVKIKIAGQEYSLKAQEADVDRLHAMAEKASKRVQELQKAGVGSTLRAGLMAAFQFAYEAAEAESATPVDPKRGKEVTKRLRSMISKIDKAID